MDALADSPLGGAPEPSRRQDAELRWIIGHNVDLFVRTLRTGHTDFDEDDAPDLVASAARRASQGSPIEELLHDYQTGLGAIWRVIASKVNSDEAADLLELTAAVHTYLLRTTTLVLRGFQHESSRISMGERDARFSVYVALLSGEAPEVAAHQAGLSLSEHYLVLKLRLQTATRAEPAKSGAGLASVRAPQIDEHRRANTVQRVLGEHADGDVLALVREPTGTALVPLDLSSGTDGEARARAMVADLSESLDARVYAGAEIATRGEIKAAASLAEDVLDVAVGIGARPGTYVLSDVVIPYQLTRPGPARALLERRLAFLDDHPEWETTLRAYVRHGSDRRATAAELHLHPNTVDYRLRRIAEACGVDPTAASQRAVMYAALCVRDLAGTGHDA